MWGRACQPLEIEMCCSAWILAESTVSAWEADVHAGKECFPVGHGLGYLGTKEEGLAEPHLRPRVSMLRG